MEEVRDKLRSILTANGFEIKEKSFMQEENDFSVYNKKIDGVNRGEFVDYLEHPYRSEVESLLQWHYNSAELNLLLDYLKEGGKIILKKICI